MSRIKLTTTEVAKAKCPSGNRKVDFFDVRTKGLMLEVRAGGGRTYYLRYQNERGKTRQMKLADAKDVTLSQARALADRARNKIAMGNDPLEDKAILRQVPRFSDFVHDQYLPYIKTYKRSWECDASLLKNHLLPRFASRPMDAITRQDIVKIHHTRLEAGAAPASVNRLLVLLRYIFNLAIKWDTPGVKTNPCTGVPLLEVNNKVERYLSIEEAQRLYEAVCASKNPLLRHIVSMLLLTGARKREVLDARWQDFDLLRRIWRIPISKSGQARHVPLADGALHILATLPRNPNTPFVFANPQTNKPFGSIFVAWNTARSLADLPDVRIHDLRHSFASLLVNAGRTLYEVQHILGHTQVKTTERYAHLSQSTLLAAANTATSAVGTVMLPTFKPSTPKK